jgi:hypothetical protein
MMLVIMIVMTAIVAITREYAAAQQADHRCSKN